MHVLDISIFVATLAAGYGGFVISKKCCRITEQCDSSLTTKYIRLMLSSHNETREFILSVSLFLSLGKGPGRDLMKISRWISTW